MNFLNYIIEAHEKATKVLSLEWSVGIVFLVLFLIPKKYYILAFYLLRLTTNPISFYKYTFDRSRKIKGETFIPQLLSDGYSINEIKGYKEFSVTSEIRFFVDGEENFQFEKIKVRTSLSNSRPRVEQSTLIKINDEISDFVITVTNELFDEILINSSDDRKGVFINFDSNKSVNLNRKGWKAEMCFLTDLSIRILSRDDFLIEILPFMKDKFTEEEKMKIMVNHAARKMSKTEKSPNRHKGKIRHNLRN